MTITTTHIVVTALVLLAVSEAYKASNEFFEGKLTYGECKRAVCGVSSWVRMKAAALVAKYKAKHPEATAEEAVEAVKPELEEAIAEKAQEA